MKIFRFFFPDDTRIKVEAVTMFAYDPDIDKLIIHREFHTFRALVSFYYGLFKLQPSEAFSPKYNWILNPQRGGIAFDAVDTGGSSTGTTTTITHVCTGSNLALTVGTLVNNADATGVTYNSIAMTEQRTQTIVTTVSGTQVQGMWILPAPASGSHDVVITTNIARARAGGVISFSGAAQSSMVDGDNIATGTSNAPSVVVTTSVNNTMVVDTTFHENALTGAVESTADYNFSFSLPMGGHHIQKVTAGSQTMSWTATGSFSWGSIGVGIKEFTGHNLGFNTNKLRPRAFGPGLAR